MMRRMRQHIARLRGFCILSVLLAVGCGTSHAHIASNTNSSVAVAVRDATSSQGYRVPSGSMEPTLPIGTRVTVRKGTLTVGDIVVAIRRETL